MKVTKVTRKWEIRMKRSIFGKIKENHLLAMIICCAIPLIAI